jgi:hypothetical protein
MILSFFFYIACAMNLLSFSMDREPNELPEQEPETKPVLTYEKIRQNKINFISDVFTRDASWQKAWAEKGSSFLAYRKASNLHKMPRFAMPSNEQKNEILTYTIQRHIMYSLPMVTYAEYDDDFSCVGCNDTSLHLQVVPREGPRQHIYIPPCHTRRISSITPVAPGIIAVAGGNAITFCNIDDKTYTHKRIVFDEPYTIRAITRKLISDTYDIKKGGALVIETEPDEQRKVHRFKLYPYDTELYYLLRGKYLSADDGQLKDLSRDQIQVVFLAADALHYNKQLQLTDAEDKCYEELPGALKDYIDYFLVQASAERLSKREETSEEDDGDNDDDEEITEEEAEATIDSLIQQLHHFDPAQ